MPDIAYAAARTVAPRIRAHFLQHGGAPAGDESLVPAVADIEQMIDAAFWTSLQREEGYVPRISLAYVPPERTSHPLMFGQPLPLTAAVLAKVAPAVERPGIHLGVSMIDGDLQVWGAARQVPMLAMVLEVSAPGLIVIKHHRGGQRGKFVNVAVLEGGHVRVVDEHALSLPDCPTLLTSLLGFDQRESAGDVNVLVQLAVSMRAHGRGGLLLVVPDAQDEWCESIVQPVRYRLEPPFVELAALMRADEDGRDPAWHEAVARAVDSIAGLTAVDGATIITRDYELLAFGAKVARRRGGTPVSQVMLTEPIEDGEAVEGDPAQLGGTRHLAAAQFAFDQRGTTALVASQDGRFTVVAWSPCENMVHAHRVETLLL
jgi:hypothetical protein